MWNKMDPRPITTRQSKLMTYLEQRMEESRIYHVDNIYIQAVKCDVSIDFKWGDAM